MCISAKEIFSDNNFLSAIIGAVIGGSFTLLGSLFTSRLEKSKERRQKEADLREFLSSIRTEAETLWNQYSWGMGSTLEKLEEGKPLLAYYPVTQNYFIVFDNNTNLIGQIRNQELKKLIVTTYVQAKGLIDSYRMNNEMVQKYENFMFLYQQTNNQIFKHQADAVLNGLISYATGLKFQHSEIKLKIDTLLNLLEKEI